MNHDPRFPLPDDDAREWAAQERALAEERAGLAPAQGDPQLRSYRLVAHALAQPLDAQLPPDFARRVARQAARAARPADTRLERNLLVVLAATMALAALAATMMYGAEWLPSLDLGRSVCCWPNPGPGRWPPAWGCPGCPGAGCNTLGSPPDAARTPYPGSGQAEGPGCDVATPAAKVSPS